MGCLLKGTARAFSGFILRSAVCAGTKPVSAVPNPGKDFPWVCLVGDRWIYAVGRPLGALRRAAHRMTSKPLRGFEDLKNFQAFLKHLREGKIIFSNCSGISFVVNILDTPCFQTWQSCNSIWKKLSKPEMGLWVSLKTLLSTSISKQHSVDNGAFYNIISLILGFSFHSLGFHISCSLYYKNFGKIKKILNTNAALRSRHSIFGQIQGGIASSKSMHAEYRKFSVYMYSTYVFIDCSRSNIHMIIISLKSLTLYTCILPFLRSVWWSQVVGDPSVPVDLAELAGHWGWWISSSPSYTIDIVQHIGR